MRTAPPILLALLLSTVALAGCSDKNGRGPKTADPSGQPAYAIRYPENLTRTTGASQKHEQAARTSMSKWGAFPGQLKNTDWEVVGKVIDTAAEDGKSASFDEEAERQQHVQAFLDEEREPLVKKIGGSAQYTAKQGGCNVEVYGAVAGGFKDAFDERFKARIRERGDAFILIERNQEKIGKANLPAVQDTAASVAETSWRVNVALERESERLKEVAGRAGGVRSTLDDFIEDEKKLQAEPGRTPEEVKSSQERVTLAEKSRADLDAAEQAAKDAVAQHEEKRKALKTEFENALSELEKAIAEKAKSEPKTAAK